MEFKTISAEDFLNLLESGKALNILDVRNKAEHEEKHLLSPHLNIPIDELESKKPFGEDEVIYILCGGGGRATRAAQALANRGYENATVVTGGLRRCISNGAQIGGKDIKSAVSCNSGN